MLLSFRGVMCFFSASMPQKKFWGRHRGAGRHISSYDESRHVSPLNRVFLGFELAAAAAGIEFRCGLSLRSGRYRWKCSYQYGLSESDCRPISLIDDFRCPCPPSPPRGTHWLMSGSQWYFHIDTSIDDGTPATSRIDQLESDTFQTVWLMYLCIMGIIGG